MADFSDGIIGAVVGAVAGAGGLGGLWGYITRRQTDDSSTLRQWYTDLATRVRSLEDTVNQQSATIARLQVENAELRAENRVLLADIERLRDCTEAEHA
jgi:hypothetical protein